MEKPKLTLQPSEAILSRAAANIYAAYITAGRVPDGKEREWMERAVREAYQIVRLADQSVQSDDEIP